MSFRAIPKVPLRKTADAHLARLAADCPEHHRGEVLQAIRMTQF